MEVWANKLVSKYFREKKNGHTKNDTCQDPLKPSYIPRNSTELTKLFNMYQSMRGWMKMVSRDARLQRGNSSEKYTTTDDAIAAMFEKFAPDEDYNFKWKKSAHIRVYIKFWEYIGELQNLSETTWITNDSIRFCFGKALMSYIPSAGFDDQAYSDMIIWKTTPSKQIRDLGVGHWMDLRQCHCLKRKNIRDKGPEKALEFALAFQNSSLLMESDFAGSADPILQNPNEANTADEEATLPWLQRCRRTSYALVNEKKTTFESIFLGGKSKKGLTLKKVLSIRVITGQVFAHLKSDPDFQGFRQEWVPEGKNIILHQDGCNAQDLFDTASAKQQIVTSPASEVAYKQILTPEKNFNLNLLAGNLVKLKELRQNWLNFMDFEDVDEARVFEQCCRKRSKRAELDQEEMAFLEYQAILPHYEPIDALLVGTEGNQDISKAVAKAIETWKISARLLEHIVAARKEWVNTVTEIDQLAREHGMDSGNADLEAAKGRLKGLVRRVRPDKIDRWILPSFQESTP
jgi:hypothetical protein